MKYQKEVDDHLRKLNSDNIENTSRKKYHESYDDAFGAKRDDRIGNESLHLRKSHSNLSVARKLSSPTLINSTEVLTASFQIPFQKNQTSSLIPSMEDLNSNQKLVNATTHDPTSRNFNMEESKNINYFTEHTSYDKGIHIICFCLGFFCLLKLNSLAVDSKTKTLKVTTKDDTREVVKKLNSSNFEQISNLDEINRNQTHRYGPIYKRQEIISSAQSSEK